MSLFSKTENKAGQVDRSRLPRHIAIIMDGNGRWAKGRGLPRTAGHKVGAETFRKVAKYCRDLGIPYLTVYAFSTENWNRPQEEVDAIMGLLKHYLRECIDTMEKDKNRLRFLGDLSVLDDETRDLIRQTDEISARIEGFQANICLNYGGRDEILRAARALAASGGEWTEEALSAHLDSRGIPDPDIIIRPGGECRISNFLLWQGAYSELFFTDKLWPDFTENDIDVILRSYALRERRFGGI